MSAASIPSSSSAETQSQATLASAGSSALFQAAVEGVAGSPTFLWRGDGDGLRRELLVKVTRVRLRGDLRLERWDQLGQTGSAARLALATVSTSAKLKEQKELPLF